MSVVNVNVNVVINQLPHIFYLYTYCDSLCSSQPVHQRWTAYFVNITLIEHY